MIKYAKAGDLVVPVQMDRSDVMALGSRSLSLGSHGYAQIFDSGRVKLLHRWILGLEVGNPLIGDHINRNIWDNRRSNLRAVTPSESNMNRDPSIKSSWGLGIRPQKSGRFVVMIKRSRVEYRLGTWDSVEEAAEARESFLLGPITRQRAKEIALSAPHSHSNGTWVKCRVCNPGIRPYLTPSGRWSAKIFRNRQTYNLGTYDTEADAQQAVAKFAAGSLTQDRAKEFRASAVHTHPSETWVKCRTCNPPR